MKIEDVLLALRMLPENMAEWEKITKDGVGHTTRDHPDYPKDIRMYRSFLKRTLPLIRKHVERKLSDTPTLQSPRAGERE